MKHTLRYLVIDRHGKVSQHEHEAQVSYALNASPDMFYTVIDTHTSKVISRGNIYYLP